QLLAWYADFRLRALVPIKEFIGARKLIAACGWVKHVIMYEFLSRDSRERVQAEVEKRHPDGIAWTKKFIPALTHAPRSPGRAERIGPQVKCPRPAQPRRRSSPICRPSIRIIMCATGSTAATCSTITSPTFRRAATTSAPAW